MERLQIQNIKNSRMYMIKRFSLEISKNLHFQSIVRLYIFINLKCKSLNLTAYVVKGLSKELINIIST